MGAFQNGEAGATFALTSLRCKRRCEDGGHRQYFFAKP